MAQVTIRAESCIGGAICGRMCAGAATEVYR